MHSRRLGHGLAPGLRDVASRSAEALCPHGSEIRGCVPEGQRARASRTVGFTGVRVSHGAAAGLPSPPGSVSAPAPFAMITGMTHVIPCSSEGQTVKAE